MSLPTFCQHCGLYSVVLTEFHTTGQCLNEIRDRFAVAALPGVMEMFPEGFDDEIARATWDLAEAMLQTRPKGAQK